MKVFNVKVRAGAKKENIKKIKGDRYEITVKEPAKNGVANRRIKEIIADLAGVPSNSVRLTKGGKSPSKTFVV